MMRIDFLPLVHPALHRNRSMDLLWRLRVDTNVSADVTQSYAPQKLGVCSRHPCATLGEIRGGCQRGSSAFELANLCAFSGGSQPLIFE